MKKITFLFVMLLCSTVSFAQANNLPGVLTVKDALSIYKNGFGEARSMLAELGYDFYGYDDIANHWAKNCEYDNDKQRAVKFGKGTSSVITVPAENSDVTITVFNEAAFNKLKNQIIALGYKKTDSWGSSSGTYSELYTKQGMPNITASNDSAVNHLPYNIYIGNEM